MQALQVKEQNYLSLLAVLMLCSLGPPLRRLLPLEARLAHQLSHPLGECQARPLPLRVVPCGGPVAQRHRRGPGRVHRIVQGVGCHVGRVRKLLGAQRVARVARRWP